LIIAQDQPCYIQACKRVHVNRFDSTVIEIQFEIGIVVILKPIDEKTPIEYAIQLIEPMTRFKQYYKK
jgi:hypothetical protein